jgi:hypothetical protein
MSSTVDHYYEIHYLQDLQGDTVSPKRHCLAPKPTPQKRAYGGHTVDSPMCAVCPAPLFLCLVDLNVRDEEGVYIKAFHLQPETCQLNSLPNKAQ